MKDFLKKYHNINMAKAKIIELKGILNMPKPTEHYLSDIHGQYQIFSHVINNASGVIRGYIDELFLQELTEDEKKELATLIYYPNEKLKEKCQNLNPIDYYIWQKSKLLQLIKVTSRVASKYTHFKVREAYDSNIYHILDEIIFEDFNNLHKGKYYSSLIENIIALDEGATYIEALAKLIKRFAVETLHIIGDIYDRGKEADKIMDFLIMHQDAHIQWGNHDIAWMGAAFGSPSLIANVLRIAAKYNNLETVEKCYGIDLNPLKEFAEKTYSDATLFHPKSDVNISDNLISKIHKAISIIQFKCEAEVIKRNPNFQMEDLLLLDKINFQEKTIIIGENTYSIEDLDLPTVKSHGLNFSPEESQVVNSLVRAFTKSEKLMSHVLFLINNGALYEIANYNLLFHGCIPLDSQGNFKDTYFLGQKLSGKKLLDALNKIVKENIFTKNKLAALDIMWYLWCGPDSPLFGKDRITTFERYFIKDKNSHIENRNPYYTFRENENVAIQILRAFNLHNKNSKIINGHTPVKRPLGESPIKANGKVIVIDGGFAKAYHKETGTYGYTLISNSYGLVLASHEPLNSKLNIVKDNVDITSGRIFVQRYEHRRKVEDTDLGEEIKEKIFHLEKLVSHFERTEK